MKRLFFSLFFIVCLFNFIQAEKVVISVPFISHERIEEYIRDGFDIAQVFTHTNEVHIVVNPEQKLYFEARYGPSDIVFTEAEMRENLVSTHRSIPGYRTYAQIVQALTEYSLSYPNLVELIELGPTQGKLYFQEGKAAYANYNHSLYGVKVSNNVSVYQDKPNYYFTGAIHAREPLTAETVMTILHDLLTSYSPANPEHPINTSQIWFVPVMNPDGHQVVISQLSTMHRKTLFDNNNNSLIDIDIYGNGNSIDGIDANRNFSYMWGTTGISWSFNSQTYPGTHAFSAVEASYIKNLAEEIPFIAGISYHTYGNLVLWPYGYAYGSESHNKATVESLAIELANLIPRWNSSLKYTPQASWELYPASGGSEEYMHYFHNSLSFTIEMADQFIPNAAQVQFHTENSLPAAYHLLSRHKNKFLTGLVTDLLTGLPIKAEIKVFPNDLSYPERAPIYSDIRHGRYNYPLMPGQYQLYVRAENYFPFLTDFTIQQIGQTVINVELQPAESFSKNLILAHHSIPDFFNNASVRLVHTRTDFLNTDEFGIVNVADISPGNMTILAKSSDLLTYITKIYLSEEDLRNHADSDAIVIFDDFTYVDEFTSFSGNWTAHSNWTISTADPFSGSTAARVTTFANNNALVSINPIQIPAGEKTFISFMSKYSSTMQSEVYIEFQTSPNNTTWTTQKQIRNTFGWENFFFEIPEDTYSQIYFRFLVRRHASASPGAFNLDLFSVKVGEATFIDPAVFNPPKNLSAVLNGQSLDLSWETPESGNIGTFVEYNIYKNNELIYNTESLNYTDNALISGHIYRYHVTAVYADPDRESLPSNVIPVYYGLPPNPVGLITPVDEELEVDLLPKFTWEFAEEGAILTGLKFYLTNQETNHFLGLKADDANSERKNTEIIWGDYILLSADDTEYTLKDELEYETAYFWCVVAFNDTGDSIENEVYSFTTKKRPTVPDHVLLISPMDEEVDVDISPVFIWALPESETEMDGLKFYISSEKDVWDEYILLPSNTTEYTVEYELEAETMYFWRVIAFNEIGDSLNNAEFSFVTQKGTSDGIGELPVVLTELYGNFPNPFNPETVIYFGMAEPGNVSIEIYNIRGQKIKNILNRHMDKGRHSISWNGTDELGRAIGSGLYLYVMRTDQHTSVKRMLLMK